MKTKISIISLFLLFFIQSALLADNQNKLNQSNIFSFETLQDSTLQEGFSGNYFGKQGNYFLMAGGSAFPYGKPWQQGKKVISSHIFVFEKNEKNIFQLINKENQLPMPMAEGAYASIDAGLLCIGGITDEGLTNKVFILSYNDNAVKTLEYPELPVAVKNATATTIGSKVYLLGGILANGITSNQLLVLDTEHLSKGWQSLADFPIPVSGSTIAAQQDGEGISLFVFGGRAKLQGDNVTTFYPSVYRYKTLQDKWDKRSDILTTDDKTLPLSLAVAAPIGASHILLYGGDTGSIFNQVETAINTNEINKRDSLWINHPGFNREILVYNTVTDAWYKAGDTASNAVAVASNLSDGANIYIAGGEIRPGVRSPYITQLYYTSAPSFGRINYLVLFLYFGGMLLLGFYFMKRNKNTEDFFKGGGRIPWWAVGISIFATTLSAITFLSIPAKTYATDWRMLVFNMTILLIVPFVIRYFLPFFRRFNLETAYEYLEIRFSRGTRWLASTLFVLFMVSRIAIVLFLPSLALNAVTGFNIYLSIILMGIVTIIYSTSGGMEAVVWGDVIQGFILVFGAISALVFMILGIEGGFSEFWSTTIEYHKFQTFDFDFDFDFTQPVFWVVLIGGISNSLITYTSDQSIVQRYMSTKDEKATAQSIWLNGILSVPITILFFLIGTGLFAFYKSNASEMMVSNPNIDSVFPQFIVSQMPVGFAGLLIAAIFAAAMSTLSSNINSSSAVITSDFYKLFFPKSTFKNQMSVARWSGIICGLLGLGMALVLATWNIASLWDQFNTFLGLLTSGLGALFILGIFFPKVGSKSALTGVVLGLGVLVFVKNNFAVSFLLYGFIGMVAGITLSYLISFIFPNQKEIKGYTWKSIKK